MHYIRFLKVPKLILTEAGSPSKITATVSITTDLGEDFFPDQVQIVATVVDNRSVLDPAADSVAPQAINPHGATGYQQSQVPRDPIETGSAQDVADPVMAKASANFYEDVKALNKKRKKDESSAYIDASTDSCLLSTQSFTWKGNGQRALPIELSLPRGQKLARGAKTIPTDQHLVLHLSPKDGKMASLSMQDTDAAHTSVTVMPLLIPVSMRATPMNTSSKTHKVPNMYAERLLDFARSTQKPENDLGHGIAFKILEETGDSIARHTWDAGLALIAILDTFPRLPQSPATPSSDSGLHRTSNSSQTSEDDPLQTSINGRIPSLDALLAEHIDDRGKRLRILELGAGTGTVGLWFKKVYVEAVVLLTDLPDAEQIARVNIEALSSSILVIQNNGVDETHESTVAGLDFYALDWEDPILPPEYALTQWDLIIASDCIYNTDSIPLLVGTFTALCKESPASKILVATKRRHDSEAMFFDLMRTGNFSITSRATVSAPMQMLSEDDEIHQKIHLYIFEPTAHTKLAHETNGKAASDV